MVIDQKKKTLQCVFPAPPPHTANNHSRCTIGTYYKPTHRVQQVLLGMPRACIRVRRYAERLSVSPSVRILYNH